MKNEDRSQNDPHPEVVVSMGQFRQNFYPDVISYKVTTWSYFCEQRTQKFVLHYLATNVKLSRKYTYVFDWMKC